MSVDSDGGELASGRGVLAHSLAITEETTGSELPTAGEVTPEQAADVVQRLMNGLSAGTLSMNLTATLDCQTCGTPTTQTVFIQASVPSHSECSGCHVRRLLTSEQRSQIDADWRTLLKRVQTEMRRKARKKPVQGTTLNPFTDSKGLAPFASGAPVLGACHAINKASNWQENENGEPRYVHRMDSGNMIFEYRITNPAAPSYGELSTEEADFAFKVLRKMGTDTLALHIAVSVYSTQTARGEAAAIDRNVVYWALGLDTRKDLSREQKDQRCWDEIRRLASIGITVLQLRGAGFNKVEYRKLSTPLWTLSTDAYGQLDLQGRHENWQLICRPGEWGDIFLHGRPRRQLGYLSSDLLGQIDRQRAPLALHLGVLLHFEGRFEPTEWIAVRNGRFLDFAGIDLTEASKNRKLRNDAKNNLLSAILEMESWGCQADYSNWPADLRPDLDLQRANNVEDRPGHAVPRNYPRGYWDRLLQAETRFRLPTHLVETNRMAKGLSWARKSMGANEFGQESIRELRTKLGWSKERMARYIGVSGPMILYWERGTRRVASRHHAKLVELKARLGMSS